MEFELLHDWIQGGPNHQRNIVKEGIITGDGVTTSVDASFFGLDKVNQLFWLIAGDAEQVFVGLPSADGSTVSFLALIANTAGGDELESSSAAPLDATDYRVTVIGE